MKCFFIIIVALALALGGSAFSCAAQEASAVTAPDSVEAPGSDPKLIVIDIPKKMKIEDKIKIVNNTQTTILQAAVVLINDDSSITPLASIGTVHPGFTVEMASFDDEWLKKIRGKRIGIKVKGLKKAVIGRNTTIVAGGAFPIGGGSISVDRQNIDAAAMEQLSNPDEDLITYEYFAHIHEDSHDLYITVTNGTNALDF